VNRVLTTEELKEQEINEITNLIEQKFYSTVQSKDEEEELDVDNIMLDDVTGGSKKKVRMKKKPVRKSKRHKLFHF
jgi:isopentenyl phosphate kinase